MSRPEYVTRSEIIEIGCACGCFVKIDGNSYSNDIGDQAVEVSYGQIHANDYAHRSMWRSRIKRAYLALRNRDWENGFELYDEETAVEFAEKFAEVVWHTFPPKPITEADAN